MGENKDGGCIIDRKLVLIGQTARYYIPEDGNVKRYRSDNLESRNTQ
jgi:hypothetical protein